MSLSEYFEQHEEQAFIAKALVTAVAIILARNFLCGLIGLLILFFPLIFLIVIKMQAAASGVETRELLREHITFLPVLRSPEERRLEAKPWVTYGLVFANIVIFYFVQSQLSPEFISDNLICLPRRPDAFNVPLSAFTAMFLHGSNGHLWGNMTFLWVVGTAVERRLGSGKFLGLYLLTGLIASLVFLLVEFLSKGVAGHALGASGAIAGIMGIFAVRCYFKTMIFPFPILGIFSLIFPVSLKVKLNSLVVMALFFLSDLSGGIDQIAGTSDSMVGHWAHLGGMISGIVLAGFLKLGDQAVEERHLVIGVKAAGESVGFGGGERSLQIVLERNPDNVEALVSLARLKTKFSAGEEGKAVYEKAIRLMLTANSSELAEVFREYRGKFHTVPQDPQVVARLAELLRQAGEHDACIFCLKPLVEMADANPQLKEKALFQLATLLEFTGCDEAAHGCFARFAAEYPASLLAEKARSKAGDAVYRVPAAAAPAPAEKELLCPACSSKMSQRVAQSGPYQGKSFLVCSEYPSCKTSMPVEEAGEACEHNAFHAPATPSSYRLVFAGELPFSSDPEETRANIARLLRLGREQVDRLFRGQRTVLKRGLDHATAVKMKQSFDRTGACCLIEEEENRAAAAQPLRVPQPAALTAETPAPPSPRPADPLPAATLAEEPFHCPKCGHPQQKEECCERCGVYFAKLALRAEREMNPLYASSPSGQFSSLASPSA